MRIFKSLFQFYIDASIHVALAVTSLALISIWVFDIPGTNEILFFIFFGSIAGYNFIKYARMAGLHHRSLAQGLKVIQVFSFLSMGATLYFWFQLPRNLIIISMVFAVFTLLYALPFLKKKSLRTIAGVKIFVVALVWSGVSALLPLLLEVPLSDSDLWLRFFQVFFLVVVWTLVFEIRDLPYDSVSLSTVPQVVGVKKTKGFGIALLVLVLFLEGFKDELLPSYMLSLFIVIVLSGVLLVMAQKKQPKYFASFVVESIPIVWMFIFLFLRNAAT